NESIKGKILFFGGTYRCKQVRLSGSTQRRATDSSRLKAETTYSFTSAQSKATATNLWTKANALNSTLFKATAVRKLRTSLNCKSIKNSLLTSRWGRFFLWGETEADGDGK